ncbi:hypothetical protein EVAR_92062_1 [Eumeta japonica]|uniref:Uncharacterized protein n=1 Tax=Eumeta variegata TaxID=151549 RepID=A0A4C1SZ26_EUMVA|nr:hypothetical protein EVAR_92062_1 [Eumeta japonica]
MGFSPPSPPLSHGENYKKNRDAYYLWIILLQKDIGAEGEYFEHAQRWCRDHDRNCHRGIDIDIDSGTEIKFKNGTRIKIDSGTEIDNRPGSDWRTEIK